MNNYTLRLAPDTSVPVRGAHRFAVRICCGLDNTDIKYFVPYGKRTLRSHCKSKPESELLVNRPITLELSTMRYHNYTLGNKCRFSENSTAVVGLHTTSSLCFQELRNIDI